MQIEEGETASVFLAEGAMTEVPVIEGLLAQCLTAQVSGSISPESLLAEFV